MMLQTWRKAKKISLAKAAAIIGNCLRNTVFDWERGKYMPSPEMISQIEGATDGQVTLSDHFAAWCRAHKDLRRDRLAAGRRAAKEWGDNHANF